MAKDIRPIDHDTGSAVATTAGSAVGQGIKSGFKWSAAWVFGFALLGLAIGTGFLPWALGMIGAGMAAISAAVPAASGATAVSGAVLGKALLWTVGLGIVGLFTVGVPAVLGSLFGVGKGLKDGTDRVRDERTLARSIRQEIAMPQPQQARYTGLAPQGSSMNQAMSTISADTAVSEGRMNQIALQRA